MTLFKRGSWWHVKWMKRGVLHHKALRTQSKRQALALVRDVETAAQAPTFESAVELLRMIYGVGGGVGGASLALADAWGKYEETAKAVGRAAVAEKTWRMRRERLAAFVKWAKGKVETVEAVDGRIAAAYAAALAKSGKKSKTRQNIIGELAGIWRLLEKVSPSIHNPWTGLAPRDTDSERLPPFTPAQEAAVLAAAEKVGKGWPLACLIARHTGLRYGDVAQLRWNAVDMAARVIRLTPQKTAAHGIAVAIPIAAPLYAALKSAQADANGSPFVLPGHAAIYGDVGRGAYDALNFREVLDAAKIKGTRHTFHSWRHTFRTRLAEAGVSTETAMRLCGHTNAAMSGHYDHAEHLPELREAVDKAAR